ncbi:DUF6578 domain-containing protein [Streptomyces sp. ISL-100]|uniref:DUF6578 domain-containing protein n=1 Tax=Streptomyces sp. ISL-100 TaxID=2819173 RepID=UPI001BEB3918|nr:DUF6578 domain-containing protein [Streptomyces sp. ISL-100]MBT2399539.1 hypothetical protein [Streptomyces sp. ISL-100]
MALWRMKYDDWQMECCGEPFSVGDEVRWRLALRGPDEGARRPGLTALYAGEPVTHPVGLLAVETHGPGQGGSRTYEPVAGERWLRAVGTCPKWFSNETRPDRRGRGYRRDETGVLVELETPGGASSPARPGE